MEFHNVYLNVRNINNFIQTLKVELTGKQLAELKDMCMSFDTRKVKDFIFNLSQTPVEEMSVRQLRLIAKSLHIDYYTTLCKRSLIREIKHVNKRHKESS